jgi:hypothetical protein
MSFLGKHGRWWVQVTVLLSVEVAGTDCVRTGEYVTGLC